jgi:Polyketide cyclase / dehydrase and lipid transport
MAEVKISKRYEVSGADMWERIGDPARIFEWHPAVEATEMRDGGQIRIDTLADGGRVAATILEQGERHHIYRVDESPLPVENLIGTISLRDQGEGACEVEWEATFEPVGIAEQEAIDLVRGIFQAGLDAL